MFPYNSGHHKTYNYYQLKGEGMQSNEKSIEKYCENMFFQTTSLIESAQCLEEIKNLILGAKNKQTLIKIVGGKSLDYANMHYSNIYFSGITTGEKQWHKVFSKEESIPMLISSQLSILFTNNKVSSFKTLMNSTIEILQAHSEGRAEDGCLIEINVVNDIVKTKRVQTALKLIGEKVPVFILNLDYTGPFNSFSFPYINIIVNAKYNANNGEIVDASYIFMHELGHLLLPKLTQLTGELPSDFWKLIKFGLNNENYEEIPKEHLLEIFADGFAVACANGTIYEDKNPFIGRHIFGKQNIEYITNYFDDILANVTN